MIQINNNVNTGRSTNYAYDLLNRITAGWHVNATDWGSQYSLDNWGNLSQKAPCNNTMGCPTRTSGEGFSAGMNANNQFNTYSYDASGNMLNDQLGHTFSYDAETRPYSAGGVTYYYDGAGERAAKSNGRVAGPSASLISILHHEHRVARPCVFCKGGSTHCLGQPALATRCRNEISPHPGAYDPRLLISLWLYAYSRGISSAREVARR